MKKLITRPQENLNNHKIHNIPYVSIIFPTFNGWNDTRQCLESIKKMNYPEDKIETIIIDNHSTDETYKGIKKQFGWVNFVRLDKNFGFAKAVNVGIKMAKGKYLLISNNDVIFEKRYLINLVNFLQENPDVGIVGGKVYYKHPQEKISFAAARFNFYTGLLRLHKASNKISTSDWIPACNMLIKREVLTNIGNFDEEFFFYFEDLDLCLRAKKAGYKIIYYPKATLWHGEGVSINQEDPRRKTTFYYQGMFRTLFKHASPLQLASSILFQFMLDLPYQLLVVRHQNYTLAIKALLKTTSQFFNSWKE